MHRREYVPEHPHTVGSADAMLDAPAYNGVFSTFNIADEFNRKNTHIEVDTSITSPRQVRISDRIRQERSLLDVREATWRFLIDSDERRPHDALGGMTLTEYRSHHEYEGPAFDVSD